MHLRINKTEIEELKSINHVLVDSDYLSMMYSNETIFKETYKLFGNKLTLDPFIKFEFLRDVFEPQIRANKELFINSKIFNSLPDHPELYVQVKNYAIELSQIYASQSKAKGVSLVDLMLAGQLVRTHDSAVILTGNRKDYPMIIFDTVSILNVEIPREDKVRGISLIKLNRLNLDSYRDKLEKMKQKISSEISKKINNI
ncbi:MAG: hypothetical protein RIT04_546 [Candidatus Parcubacteria bacterium]